MLAFLYSILNKLPVISNMVLCFVYGLTDVITRVCKKVANSMGFIYGPCTSRVHGRVRAVYTAVTLPCTRAVYTACTRQSTRSCIRLCTGAVSMAVYGPCTRPRINGHLHGRYGPCTRPLQHHVRVGNTAVYRPCTRPYPRPCTTVRSVYAKQQLSN